MKLEYNWKYKQYELRAMPRNLIHSDTVENHTIELIKWTKNKDGQVFCFTLAYWIFDDGYELRFVGSRPFDNINIEDIVPIWKQLVEAQKVLDDFEIDNN